LKWGVRGGLVPDLEIWYKTAKLQGTKVELISTVIISTVLAEAHQLRKSMRADDGEESSQPSSLTLTLVSQNCVACAWLIPRDWPHHFEYCWLGSPTMDQAASRLSGNLLSAWGNWALDPETRRPNPDYHSHHWVWPEHAGSRCLFSLFLSWVSKTQPNHWTKRMANTRLATLDPRTCPGPENQSIT